MFSIIFTYVLTHSLTHSLTYLLTYLSTYLLTYLPIYLLTYFAVLHCAIFSATCEAGKHSFHYRGAVLWNSLSNDTRSQTNLRFFLKYFTI